MTYEGFILTTSQVIRNRATQLIFQGRLSDGRRFHWIVSHPRVVFFINREEKWSPSGALRKEVELRNLRGQSVDALYFRNTMDLSRGRTECDSRGSRTYEADVNPAARFLMEHFIQGAVAFDSEPDLIKEDCLYFVDPFYVKGRLPLDVLKHCFWNPAEFGPGLAGRQLHIEPAKGWLRTKPGKLPLSVAAGRLLEAPKKLLVFVLRTFAFEVGYGLSVADRLGSRNILFQPGQKTFHLF